MKKSFVILGLSIVRSSEKSAVILCLLGGILFSSANAEIVYYNTNTGFTSATTGTITIPDYSYQRNDSPDYVFRHDLCVLMCSQTNFCISHQDGYEGYISGGAPCNLVITGESYYIRGSDAQNSIVCPPGITRVSEADGTCLATSIIPLIFYIAKQDKVSNLTNANLDICPSVHLTNPINTTNGNKVRQENDFNQVGLSPLKLSRYYSSNKNQSTDVGINWRHSYTSLLTANIHSQTVPYVANDAGFSQQYGSAKEACESGWNDIKGQYTQPAVANSTAVYGGTTCTISNGISPLGSIAVRDSTSGISPNPPQDNIVIERANGNTIVFTSVNGLWVAPSDKDVSLVQTTSGYTLTTAQNTIEVYNLSGQLILITDRKGIQQNLTYNATSGLLESVTDSFGQSLGFSYTGTKLTTVTLPESTQLIYSYDTNNNFVSVTREDNTVKTYVYDDVRFPNALTGIIDENNQRYMTFSYDAQGRAITSELGDGVNLSAEKVTLNYIDANTSTVTDALGQLRTYRFVTINGEKKLADIEGAPCASCGGQATHTTYDANGYVATSTDFNGNITTFINNARGLPTTRIETTGTADQRVITTLWHPTYALPLKITRPGSEINFSYDAQGNVLTRTQTDTTNTNTRLWAYSYNTYGQLLSLDGARADVNDITTYTYDTNGNLSTVANALGHVTQIKAYDARNRPLTLTDANGLITTLGYDKRGRIISRTVTGNGNSLITTFAYDNVGNLTNIALPDARVLNYSYDAAHRLTGMSDQKGNRIDYTLDQLGNRLTENVFDATNTLAQTRSQVFNMLSQLTQSIGAANQTTRYAYDLNGNQTSTTNAASQTTTNAFDALNRIISVTDSLAGVARYNYDARGNLVSIQDKKGSATTYTYDGFGNRINQTSPDTGTTTYQYDAAANIISTTDAQAQTTLYRYDALNRLIQTNYADGRVVTYTYDQGANATGRLTQIQNTATLGGNSAIAYAYDIFGRMASKAQTINGVTLTTTYTYDVQGRLSQMIYPSGKVVAYGYLNGELNSITLDNQIILNNISYQAFASVSGWSWGNGTASSRGFDLDGQLISQSLGNDMRSLSYDVKGNITNINDAQATQVFGYDALNRLTAANDSMLNNSFNQTFAYDANGNRLSLTNGAASESYLYESQSNRLTSISGSPAKTYQYDLNGNTLDDGLNSFLYDSRNRLVTVTYPQQCPAGEEAVCGTNTDDANYQFNALGQRVVKQAKNKVPDYALLNTHYQQTADTARAQATSYTAQATTLLTQAVTNEIQAASLTAQALADRTEAQNLNQQADLVAIRQQNIQASADNIYAQAASFQAKIVEPTTSFVQNILNGVYRTISATLTTVADGLQAYADNLAQQVTDLRIQATTLIANAIAAEQQAATLLATAAQNKLDAANLQLLATQQTGIASASQVKADNYLSLSVSQPKVLTETVYAYNEAGQLIGEYDNNGQVKQEVIYLGSLPIAVVKNNAVYNIHADHLGTPRAITNQNNTVIWSWLSDAFGQTAANDDPDNDGVSFEFNLRFAGQYYDSETGLHYNYFRDYDPSTGGYLQSDPIGLRGGLNTYGYVGGNPLYYTDPYGLVRWGDAGSATLGLLGNGAGVIVGGALVGAPEPTMATKIIGGIVLAKSITGWGLNWYNLTRAFSDDATFDAPSSAFRGAAQIMCPGNKDVQLLGDAAELAIDLLSGRVPLGSIPQGGSALNKAVNFSEAQNFGKVGMSPINNYVDTMQVIQATQYGSDAIN